MAISKYSNYVIRKPFGPRPGIKWGIPELGIVDLYHFTGPDGPIKEANTLVEYGWIVKNSAFGVTEEKAPHKHNCDELFWFMGTNPQNADDLGAEVEFWLGEDKETEIIKINTSTLVYVHKNLLHLPVFFKNVQRPLLYAVIALNINDSLQKTIKCPVRGI